MNKKFFLILLLPLLNFGQALSGNYLIGSGQSFPFNTLTNAVLRLNTFGVSGPVIFNLTDTNYSSSEIFPITINQFIGTSATNTLTIKPNTTVNTTISGSVSGNALILFNGADNVIIDGSNNGTTSRNLTIYNSFSTANSFAKRAVINIYNTSSKNIFKNLTLRLNILGIKVGTTSCGFMAGDNTLDNDGNNPDNEISNVVFIDVKQGIIVNGTTATLNANWKINNCTIGSATDDNKPFLGISIINSNTYNISGNTLDGLKRPLDVTSGTNAGIIATLSNTGTISNNSLLNIENISTNNTCVAIQAIGNNLIINNNIIDNINTNSSNNGNTGIFCDGTANIIHSNKISNVQSSNDKLINGIYINGNNALVYNNFVANVSSRGGGGPVSQGGYGIYINDGIAIRLYYNSVRLQTTQPVVNLPSASAALFINAGTQLTIVNNIFINAQSPGASRFAVYSNVTTASSFTSIDYNDYVSAQHIGTFGNHYTLTNIKTTLADWRSATTKDLNSINVAPSFISSSDLHLSAVNASFDNKGTPIPTFTTDIDSDPRSITPDMGADEFTKCTNGTTIWNGTAWSNGNPSITVKVIINGDYNTATNGSFFACELSVNANKTLTIAADHFVEVQNDISIDLNGSLDVKDSGSLIQNDDAAVCRGNAKIVRTSTFMKQYDYAYWSSPVANFALSSFTPNDVYSYCFNPTINNWDWNVISSTIMTTAKGYIVRAPENGLTTQKITTSFFGNPNTGVIPSSIIRSSSTGFNLIGNPYPCALSADLFLGNATNIASTMGTIFLWTHNTAIGLNNPNPGSGSYAYSSDDYAKYNKTGGVGTKSVSTGFNNSIPSGKIASGQAFFIEASSGVATKAIIFNNSMRVKGENNNNQIFRQNVAPIVTNSTINANETEAVIEKNRIWINVSNNQGAFNQMLLGYISGATDGFDNGFDGKTFEAGNYIGIYSVLDDYQLSIQGRSLAFDENKEIPLGFKNTIGGNFTIELENFDGFFQNQNVYLLDKETQILTNLKEIKYNFQSPVGEFNNRFELRFVNAALSATIPKADLNDIIIYKNQNKIQINSKSENLQSVVIYDLLGRIIFEKNNVNNKLFTSEDLQINDPFILIKIETENNSELTKKMLFR